MMLKAVRKGDFFDRICQLYIAVFMLWIIVRLFTG